MTEKEIEERLREFFEENYELLRLEGGHALTGDAKENAFNQVLHYWRKLKEIAKKVTDTEVKLTLPEQTTPKGRKFSIEGIVDIVREENETWMYDVKTHDAEYVRSNLDFYEKQLNVYAYIWQELRKNDLNHTAVIATPVPRPVLESLRNGDAKSYQRHLQEWEPVIDIPFDQKKVAETIRDFAEVVDRIEENCFEPAAVEVLQEKGAGTNTLFATRICRNCDARFSCASFREYALAAGGRSTAHFRKYIEDLGDDVDKEDWINANLSTTPPPESIDEI